MFGSGKCAHREHTLFKYVLSFGFIPIEVKYEADIGRPLKKSVLDAQDDR